MDEITIREISAAEAAALEAQVPEFSRSYSTAEIEARVLQKRSLLLGAFIEGAGAGYKCGYELQPGLFYSWIGGVLPQYRRRGVAQHLLDRQELWARKNQYSEILVKSENSYSHMLIFLLKNGYQPGGMELNGQIHFRKNLSNG